MDPARFRAASAKLETDPYDLDAWSLVIKDAQAKVRLHFTYINLG